MQNCDKALPSIILASEALSVKMLIPLEPCGTFGSNFVFICILTFTVDCVRTCRLFFGNSVERFKMAADEIVKA